MKKVKAARVGIAASVTQNVSVFIRKAGNLRFGKGSCIKVICMYYDIVVTRDKMQVRTRRVRRYVGQTHEAV